jgi:hypothetical protein
LATIEKELGGFLEAEADEAEEENTEGNGSRGEERISPAHVSTKMLL